jgi:hypothetical protein
MCSCGCNTCETKITGPLLTEGKIKSLLSEGLQYHIDKQIPLFETVYRIGSEKHLSLIKEARKMYSRGVIDLCEEDEHLIKTHLGEFGLYEGESIPLDLPMLETNESELQGYLVADIVDDIIKIIGPEFVKGQIKNTPNQNKIYLQLTDKKFANTVINLLKSELGIEAKFDTTFGFMPAVSFWADKVITEAEFKGKDVQLNKPKRGGSKAYYVYVKDPKTKRVKKVSFGSGGLRAKIKNKEARNAFAKRHRCSEKKDRTKAGYWSCNLPRYAQALGLGANMNTFWSFLWGMIVIFI